MFLRQKSVIYTLRTTIGQEKNAAALIERRAKLKELQVHSILVPESLKGYLFLEVTPEDLDKAIQGIPHVRSKVVGKVQVDDLDKLLIPRPTIQEVNVGDIVEITSGPFKQSRARIAHVNMAREEVTVELLDSPVTIPVVIHADYVRKVESAREELSSTRSL